MSETPKKEDLLAAIAADEAGNEAPVEEAQAGDEQPEYTEVEVEAMEHGWNPEGVEGKRTLTAEEFMDRQPLYDDIRSLKKQLRKTQDGIEAMKKMQDGIRQRAAEEAIAKLKADKRTALEDGDFDAVMDIDDKIAAEKAAKDAEPQTNEAFEEWVDNNDWYHQNEEMREYADMIGTGYVAQKGDKTPPAQVFAYVEQEVKRRFADKFENPRRKAPQLAESAAAGRGSGGTRSSGAKHKAAELPETDRQIMRTIVRSGAMTEAEYLKEYFGE